MISASREWDISIIYLTLNNHFELAAAPTDSPDVVTQNTFDVKNHDIACLTAGMHKRDKTNSRCSLQNAIFADLGLQ